VQCGVRVYEKRITDSPVDDGHVDAIAGSWIALGDAVSKLPAAIVHGPLIKDTSFDSGEWAWPARVIAWPLIKPLNIFLGGFDDRVGKRVGTFYPREWGHGMDTWPLALVIASIASAFGGIHCVGWSFTFHSSTERTLWRVASVSITSVPIALFLPFFLVDCDALRALRALRNLLHLFLCQESEGILVCYTGLLLFVYVLSRLVLLILPFLTLRSLPPATYHTIHWTSFILHI